MEMMYYRSEPCNVLGKADRFGRVPVWLTGANKYALPLEKNLTKERTGHVATKTEDGVKAAAKTPHG